MSESAYPLAWPDGWPRTKNPQRARFDVTDYAATCALVNEIVRIGGSYVVISTNVPLRRDGLPYANQKPPADTGVAVYFKHGKKQMVFACDRWDRVRDNMRAIANTIEALRGIERWGASYMMERAFSAFEALPAPKSWRDTFGDIRNPDDLQKAYREKAKRAHPDSGGSEAAMSELNQHYAEAKKAFENA